MTSCSTDHYNSSSSYVSSLHPLLPCHDEELIRTILAFEELKDSRDEISELRKLTDLINQVQNPQAPLLKLIDVILSTQHLGCSELWQVLIRLESLITNKQALAEVASCLYLSENPPSLDNAQGALWFAAYIGDHDLAREALHKGADVNLPLYLGMTALLLACKKGDDAFACLMLDHGALVKFIGGTHHHETPLSEALFKADKMPISLPRLQKLDNGFTEEFLMRKEMAHENSASVEQSFLDGVLFYLEGWRIRYALNHYLTSTRSFYETLKRQLVEGRGHLYDEITTSLPERTRLQLQNHPETRAKICAAIDEMLLTLQECMSHEIEGLHNNPELMTEITLKRLESGKPAVCFGVTRAGDKWKTGAPGLHGWGLVIFKQSSQKYVVQRCNRGYGTSEPGILSRTFSYDKVRTLIYDYYVAANWKDEFPDSGLRALHEIETLMLSGIRSTATFFLKRVANDYGFDKMKVLINLTNNVLIEQKGQRIGNCCYTSTRAIARALLTRTIGDALLAKSILGVQSAHTRPQNLRNYLTTHTDPIERAHLLDATLLQKVFEKITKKPHPTHAVIPPPPTLTDLPIPLMSFAFGIDAELPSLLATSEKSVPDPLLSRISELRLSHQGLTAFDLSPFRCLASIYLSGNELTDIKISNLSFLIRLHISHNQLEQIEIDNLPKLQFADLSNNQIRELPVLKLPNLETLYLTSNFLIEIPNLTQLPKLKHIDLKNNIIKNTSFLKPNEFCTIDMEGNPPSFLSSPNPCSIEFHRSSLKSLPHILSDLKQQQISSLDSSLDGSLALLYNYLLTIIPESFNPAFLADPVDATTVELFNRLSPLEKSLIYNNNLCTKSTLRDAALLCFENTAFFYAAVHNAILVRYKTFPQRTEVDEWIQQSSEPSNLLRLAIALRRVELQRETRTPSRCRCLIL